MNYIPFIIFPIVFLIIFFDRFYSHKKVVQELQKIKKMEFKLIAKKENVRCSTMTSGRKKIDSLYRKADLYFMNDALIIAGYYNFLQRKIYKNLLIATQELEFYKDNFENADEIIIPKKLNLNSFNNDVYIEFGESSFTSTNVEIRIKNLTNEEKMQIKIYI